MCADFPDSAPPQPATMAARAETETPESGQIWRHWKGKAYRVLGRAFDADTEEEIVLYRDAENELATIWARPLEEWHHQVSASARRFERLK